MSLLKNKLPDYDIELIGSKVNIYKDGERMLSINWHSDDLEKEAEICRKLVTERWIW